MKLNYPEIKDWCIIEHSYGNIYMAPELKPKSVFGRVYGNSKFEDGTTITTSTIQRMIYEQGVIIVETKNSKYIIRKETIDEQYETIYKNVWEKLIKNIER